MTHWKKRIAIKHLLTESEEHKDIQESMNKIADVLEKEKFIQDMSVLIHRMRNIPEGDDVISAQNYANKLLDMMYNVADVKQIWIE